jgi:hypothetical protein
MNFNINSVRFSYIFSLALMRQHQTVNCWIKWWFQTKQRALGKHLHSVRRKSTSNRGRNVLCWCELSECYLQHPELLEFIAKEGLYWTEQKTGTIARYSTTDNWVYSEQLLPFVQGPGEKEKLVKTLTVMKGMIISDWASGIHRVCLFHICKETIGLGLRKKHPSNCTSSKFCP